jgi:hypothetical protein
MSSLANMRHGSDSHTLYGPSHRRSLLRGPFGHCADGTGLSLSSRCSRRKSRFISGSHFSNQVSMQTEPTQPCPLGPQDVWLIGFFLLEPADAHCQRGMDTHQPSGGDTDGLPPQNAAHVAFTSNLTVGNFPSTTWSLLPIYLCQISQLLVYVLVDLKSRLYKEVGALKSVADSMLHP